MLLPAALSAFATGCYTLQPVANGGIPLGSQIGLTLSDQGRVEMGGKMGPAIKLIEGRLVQKEGNDYTVAVSGVHIISGGQQLWNGERILVKGEFVSSVQERRFSKGRTAIVVGISSALVVAAVTRALIGAGLGEPVKVPPDSGGVSLRPTWP